jgi:hypothetical protein
MADAVIAVSAAVGCDEVDDEAEHAESNTAVKIIKEKYFIPNPLV